MDRTKLQLSQRIIRIVIISIVGQNFGALLGLTQNIILISFILNTIRPATKMRSILSVISKRTDGVGQTTSLHTGKGHFNPKQYVTYFLYKNIEL